MNTTNLAQTHDKRVGKALSALWLKGADERAIDKILATAKNLSALEAKAKWFPVILYRRVAKAA